MIKSAQLGPRGEYGPLPRPGKFNIWTNLLQVNAPMARSTLLETPSKPPWSLTANISPWTTGVIPVGGHRHRPIRLERGSTTSYVGKGLSQQPPHSTPERPRRGAQTSQVRKEVHLSALAERQSESGQCRKIAPMRNGAQGPMASVFGGRSPCSIHFGRECSYDECVLGTTPTRESNLQVELGHTLRYSCQSLECCSFHLRTLVGRS